MNALSIRLAIALAALLAMSGCSYNIKPELASAYDKPAGGVTHLYALPTDKPFKNLGLHAWGFYRPGFFGPQIEDIWPALSEKVRALDGNACIVRRQEITFLNSRSLEVTCEVIKI